MKILHFLLGVFIVIPAFGGTPAWWPHPYSVQTNGSLLTLSTPFYAITQDLHRGGTISAIQLFHGSNSNLLTSPIATQIVDSEGNIFSDTAVSPQKVITYQDGDQPTGVSTVTQTPLDKFVTVECNLTNASSPNTIIHLKTIYEYRWGYIRIHKEIFCPDHFITKGISPISMVVDSSLSSYGYRDGRTEKEGAPSFVFNSCHWGKVENSKSPALNTAFVPRYLMLANPGVEGVEWFLSSDLSQWDLQFTTNRGNAKAELKSTNRGIDFSVFAFHNDSKPIEIRKKITFDFYIGFPIHEDHAFPPWFNQSFGRNKGLWVSPDQINDWKTSGIQTVHCHNDGDASGDGLFWHDGSYPPYPDMNKYNEVITNCHKAGIRVATYFSNKELHPSTPEYQKFGTNWARRNMKGEIQHNSFNEKSEFGVQMCLRSGWLDYFKLCVDRVLKNHPLDGIYYDWNVALLCYNPRHQAPHESDAAHWDMDELLNLMEWSRQRVGTNGLLIIHNTTTPMFCLENFASHVVAHEWGYAHWTNEGPAPESLPLEWSLVGARPRGVISYGHISANAPQHLFRLFALNALVAGVTPWPASQDAVELYKNLKPLGNIEQYEFTDWRNRAVMIQEPRTASAIYSRTNEAWLIAGNLEGTNRNLTISFQPQKLKHPMSPLQSATLINAAGVATALDVNKLTSTGLSIAVPPESVVLIHVQ